MKKIAFACEANNALESEMSMHFGRCPYYMMIDVEGTEVIKTKAIENPFFNGHVPGAVPDFINNIEHLIP